MSKTILSSDFFDEIEHYASLYNEQKIPILHLGDWQPSKDYIDLMMKNFHFDQKQTNYMNYYYSYALPKHLFPKIKEKLGINNEKEISIFNNSSLSIVAVANYIKANNFKKIAIIFPYYFSISACLENFMIDFEIIHMKKKKNIYYLPHQKIISKNYDLIWLTNPVYSVGQFLLDDDIKKIEEYLKEGRYIIIDEALCTSGNEIERKIENTSNLISIYSPHKSIFFNNFKFSAISIKKEEKDFFDQWYEVYNGSFPDSSYFSIIHFLSDNFDHLKKLFDEFIVTKKYEIEEIFKDYQDFSLDFSEGAYVTVNSKTIKIQNARLYDFIKKMIDDIFVYFIPNQVFTQKIEKISFRINLTMVDNNYKNGLIRTLNYLETIFSQ